MTLPDPTPTTRYAGLDLLRAVAALAVVLLHGQVIDGVHWRMPSGYLAVDLFFAMSGFVIAQTYDERLARGTLSWSDFMIARVIRFYPLYAIGLCLGLVHYLLLFKSGYHPSVEIALALAGALFFLPTPITALDPKSYAPLDGPAYTLILEVWANLVYALCHRVLTSRVLVAIASVSITGLSLSWWHDPRSHSTLDGIWRIGFSFPLGILMFRHRALLPALPSLGIGLVPLALAAFMMPVHSTYALAFVVLLSPLLVVLGMRARVSGAIAHYGAVASYFVYILHSPLLRTGGAALHKLHLGQHATLFVVLVAAVLFAVAPLIDRLYDQPARRWLRSKIDRRRQPVAQQAVGILPIRA